MESDRKIWDEIASRVLERLDERSHFAGWWHGLSQEERNTILAEIRELVKDTLMERMQR